jgi:hypothetical protein
MFALCCNMRPCRPGNRSWIDNTLGSHGDSDPWRWRTSLEVPFFIEPGGCKILAGQLAMNPLLMQRSVMKSAGPQTLDLTCGLSLAIGICIKKARFVRTTVGASSRIALCCVWRCVAVCCVVLCCDVLCCPVLRCVAL